MEETIHKLGDYDFYQLKPSHRLTAVTVLLCDFVNTIKKTDRVVDLGTGSAVIPMLLTLKSEAKKITGIEISSNLFKLAQKNIKENNLEDSVTLVNSDWRDLYNTFKVGSFDYVISNPPYLKAGTGRISPDKDRAGARAEVYGDMNDLVDISIYLAGKEGRIYYVYPMDRLKDLKSIIEEKGLSIGRFKLVFTKEENYKNNKPGFFLIEFGVGCEYKEEECVVLDGSNLY